MEDHGFHNDGWYPHDGEGKGMCTGPGCDCDEKNYGSHSSPSNGNMSTFGAILCTVGGNIMPFKIVRNDIAKMNTEAIVNTANDHVSVGTESDRFIKTVVYNDSIK
jgi:hypothetical protein